MQIYCNVKRHLCIETPKGFCVSPIFGRKISQSGWFESFAILSHTCWRHRRFDFIWFAFTKLSNRKSLMTLFMLAKPVASAEVTLQELYEKPFPFDRAKHAACFGDHDNHAANPDADHPLYRTDDGKRFCTKGISVSDEFGFRCSKAQDGRWLWCQWGRGGIANPQCTHRYCGGLPGGSMQQEKCTFLNKSYKSFHEGILDGDQFYEFYGRYSF